MASPDAPSVITPGVLLNRDHLQTDVNHPLTPTLTRSRPLARSPGDLGSATAEQIPFAASQAAQVSPSGGEGETVAATQHTRASVGKIARLPKSIREQLNRRLDDGEPASALAEWLNGLPAVKKALHQYFGGAAISEKNISNWRLTGYARWVERQELLGEVREMAEEAADINETSRNRLTRMTATLACTKLLKQLRDTQASAADVVKIGFAIAALNNVELSHVRMKQAERALEQKEELVTLAWDKHLRDCAAIALRVLDDAQAKAIQKAPVDYSTKIELIGRRMFGHLWRKRKVGKAAEPQAGSTRGPIGDASHASRAHFQQQRQVFHQIKIPCKLMSIAPSPQPSPAGRGSSR